MNLTTFVLDPGDGGWLRWETDEPAMWGLVRVADTAGRLVIEDLYVPHAPTQRNLSKIPLSRIEHLANTVEWSAIIRPRLSKAGPLLRVAASFYKTRRYGDPRESRPDWVALMQASQRGQALSVDEAWSGFADFSDSQIPDLDLTLDVPERSPYPADFYQRFAEVYEEAAWRWSNPAPRIMDANGIENATTIHRWVRVARERGYLPPAGETN